MDMELTSEQEMLVDAVRGTVSRWREMPAGHERDYSHYSAELQDALAKGGFLAAGLDMGMLEAALVVMEVSKLPVVSSVGASALVAPAVIGKVPDGPVALIEGDGSKAQRLLGQARYALAAHGNDVVMLDMEGVETTPVDSIYAYPYARFAQVPDWSKAPVVAADAAALLRQWRRVALAAEMAGAAEAGTALTVQHVKERTVFGKPIGSFQAVQHRLAQCHQIQLAMRMLTLHAAWSGDATGADMAATYAQDHVNTFAFDLHQFSGGMGVTAEYRLHFFTYRLRALQAECGGADGAAIALHDRLWGQAA